MREHVRDVCYVFNTEIRKRNISEGDGGQMREKIFERHTMSEKTTFNMKKKKPLENVLRQICSVSNGASSCNTDFIVIFVIFYCTYIRIDLSCIPIV